MILCTFSPDFTDNGRSALERRRLKHQEGLSPTQAAAPSIGQSCHPNEAQVGSQNPLNHENSASTGSIVNSLHAPKNIIGSLEFAEDELLLLF